MKQVKLTMPRRAMALACGLALSATALAQSTVVKGQVKDATGEPVIGATIRVDGQEGGVITDLDGNFTIDAKPGTSLSISYIGYTTKTVTATNGMVVTLQDDAAHNLNEVLVIGYGRAKKSDLTGSVTAIKPDDMSKGITTTASDMLSGKVAGVNVVSDGGEPGGGATITIRGGSSLKASNKPLIVIDGLALDNDGVSGVSNPLSMVNPADIESFTVLKDASATAIYGSRASNGVIIITTKKGNKSKGMKVAYNGNVSAGIIGKKYDMMDANEYRNFLISQVGDEANLPAPLGTANTDWQDQIFRTAWSTDHNVSLTGNVLDMPYRVSLGYTNQNGILKTSNFERYTVSASITPSLLDKHLDINFNVKYMQSKRRLADKGAVGNALRYDPTRPVYTDDPNVAPFTGGFYQNMTNSTPNFSDPAWTNTTNIQTPQNPLALLKQKNDRGIVKDFISNLEVNYKVHGLEDLSIHASLGGDYADGLIKNVISPQSFSNNYYGWDGRETMYKYNLQGNAYVQYQHDYKFMNFSVMAGTEEQHYHKTGSKWGHGTDPITQTYYNEQLASENAWGHHVTLLSYFGRANVSVLDKYMLTATIRRDGSSRFASGHRWGTFPSLAFAWNIKNELFKNNNTIDALKLRLGWGKTGQQDLEDLDFYYLPVYTNADQYAQYPFGNEYYNTVRPNAYNDELTWEKTTTYNTGLDISFLNGRIDASLDYYYRKTTDLLAFGDIPMMTGFDVRQNKNVGSLRNYGIEFQINARPIVAKDFTWQVGYNLSWNKNKITDLISDKPMGVTTMSFGGGVNYATYNAIGHPANSFWVFQQVYDQNGRPIEDTYVDRDGDGQITENDKYFYKKAAPDVTMGLTSKFIYKNWDFSFSLRASINNYVYYNNLSDYSNVSLSASGTYSNNAYLNISPAHAALGFTGRATCAQSDYFVRNASFLRCDQITLGYSFTNLFKNASYQGIDGRVYATCQNPFVITKYDGLDPEVSSGVDSNIYPRPVTFLLGVSLNF